MCENMMTKRIDYNYSEKRIKDRPGVSARA